MITTNIFLSTAVPRTDTTALLFNYKKATGLDLNSSREEFGGRFVLNQRMMDGIVELNGSLNARRVNEVWGNDGMFDTAPEHEPYHAFV